LSLSSYRDQFVLKGVMLFSVWNEEPHRRTRDLDLLGRGDPGLLRLEDVFRNLSAVDLPDEGITFHGETV
jgi:hypothetical protein